MLKAAASQNTLASPSQPSRSSRCGQSVGMPVKLERWLQSAFNHMRSMSGLSIRKFPVIGRSEEMTSPSRSAALGVPG